MPVKPTVELTDVPFFPQEKYQCGPAALATVLNYEKIKVSPESLVPSIYVPERQGSFQLEILAATRQYGQVAYVMDPSLESLLKEIEAGNPVLVLQNLGLDSYPMWHFSVVVGYDLKKSQILLRSGTTRRWETSFANFEQTWLRANYWGVVITDPTHLPATAVPAKWLQAAYDLESVQQLKAAEKAYQTATQYWPEQKNAWLALTNLYYQHGRTAQALALFNQVMPDFSTSTEMWNNYAYVLQAEGCHKAASKAAQCGLSLAPDDINLQATVAEMDQNSKQNSAQSHCPRIDCKKK
ncbi:PA2778 family cysteine peptidase [Hydrogenovibrio sp. 3SP14C1]|uniref:PA2778 family cysteine peptidase n=1 Tax=Hydrogenovibrio sp. 3SP14C1 TaxID=3038774 RepID=UPI002416B08D|nr:PA2778 family cysteine peptidase [Hydrogenovibrio sp. 3SP14C1]MDG4812132.1 PA2778 family cysteine peptidase [Hydrogenovibrio sp. 3SP14C1]